MRGRLCLDTGVGGTRVLGRVPVPGVQGIPGCWGIVWGGVVVVTGLWGFRFGANPGVMGRGWRAGNGG